MNAVARKPGMELTVLEDSSEDQHHWTTRGEAAFRLITSDGNRLASSFAGRRKTADAYRQVLAKIQPDIVVEGLWDLQAVAALFDYLRAQPRTKVVLWSETTEWDRPRGVWREGVKKLILSQFDGALVAGSAHGQYLQKLGLVGDRIGVAGGCVDNAFFHERAEQLRHSGEGRRDVGTANPYFLFVGRLVPAKNVRGLLAAYARYRRFAHGPWDLVIVGDGHEASALRALAAEVCPEGVVFAGLQQVDEIVNFYAHASCFVLPSIFEPWGLVVNEAMACGTPVLVSDRCGCAHELVQDHVSGFTFNPLDTAELAAAMEQFSNGSIDCAAVAERASKCVEDFSPERYGETTERLVLRLFGKASLRSRQSGLALLFLSRFALSAYCILARVRAGYQHSPAI
jgi:glycosyltransferase involved in cell wall biosynthesis